MELLTDTELTQYFISTWSLDFNDPGDDRLSRRIVVVGVNLFRHTVKWSEDGDSV